MRKLTDIVAKGLSIVLYPLLVPTYGMILFCSGFTAMGAQLPIVYWLVAVVGTFVLTCLLPVTAIWIQVRRGEVKDLYIDNPRERTIPYINATIGFCFWCYLLIAVLHTPAYINIIGISATVAIAMTAIINYWWKISAHMIAFGGWFGGVLSHYLSMGTAPAYTTLIIWLGCALLLMYARIHLNAHTPAQTIAGLLVGIISTLVPNIIYNYVH